MGHAAPCAGVARGLNYLPWSRFVSCAIGVTGAIGSVASGALNAVESLFSF
jgi:hypothetical protein